MADSKICLCLNGKTLQEDLQLVEQYRNWIDLVELRADFLDEDEKLSLRRFPELAGIPCILTIRRKIDGGNYNDGEASRSTLFAMALAYADTDPRKNYAYIDMEDDFYISSIQDAAVAFGTKIIRSYHNMTGPVTDLAAQMKKLRKTGFEIPKVACLPKTLEDVSRLWKQSAAIKDYDHIVIAMGPLGQPTRILSNKLNSYLTFTCPQSNEKSLSNLGQIDPITLNEIYNFRSINKETQIYGIAGYPLKVVGSPALQNKAFREHGMNSVYVPIRSPDMDDTIKFCETIGVKGLTVSRPFKHDILRHLSNVSEYVSESQIANTAIYQDHEWIGYNTDAHAFKKAILEFTGTRSLKHKKIAIIGAGTMAKAVALVVKELKGKACIFNRTFRNARELAEEFDFKYAHLSDEDLNLLDKYSDIIINTTCLGEGTKDDEISCETNDPLYFYKFKGYEQVFDLVYEPRKTPLLKRAENMGCKVCNGEKMLRYQAYEQFEVFTGEKY
ncbi:MAG: type I 3-dehydroquinate dehydratase [Treponemataceae bacterium]|nr:type I 3-dehydroquinate dehydratase [Treponemataceae bacterium]